MAIPASCASEYTAKFAQQLWWSMAELIGVPNPATGQANCGPVTTSASEIRRPGAQSFRRRSITSSIHGHVFAMPTAVSASRGAEPKVKEMPSPGNIPTCALTVRLLRKIPPPPPPYRHDKRRSRGANGCQGVPTWRNLSITSCKAAPSVIDAPGCDQRAGLPRPLHSIDHRDTVASGGDQDRRAQIPRVVQRPPRAIPIAKVILSACSTDPTHPAQRKACPTVRQTRRRPKRCADSSHSNRRRNHHRVLGHRQDRRSQEASARVPALIAWRAQHPRTRWRSQNAPGPDAKTSRLE